MRKIILTFLIFFGLTGAVFAQTDLQVLAVAKYDGSESITVKQLKNYCEIKAKQIGRKLTVDEKKQVLEALIQEKLILQAAGKAGISIPASAIDDYFIQNMSLQVGAQVTEKELNDMIVKSKGITLDQLLYNQTGMNVADYKSYLKNQLIMQQYIVQQKKDDIQKVTVSDAEVRNFYEGKKTQFVQTDMLKLFIAIVPKGTNPDAAKNKCNDLLNKYKTKKMTSDQIVAQSKTDSTPYQAGEMLVPKTESSAVGLGMEYNNLLWLFDQSEGYVSDLNETSTDYRFIVIIKKYKAKMLGLNDEAQPESKVTVYDYIKQVLLQQKQMEFVQQAGDEIVKSLFKPENYQYKKTGADLDKLLNW